MRHALFVLALAASPATAQEAVSAEIARTGLTATEARLAALATPTDADRFALGGVRFLGAVEGALQTRWAAGLSDPTGMVPFLRLPLDPNPAPNFTPDAVAALFRTVTLDMEQARAPLTAIPDTADFGVEINLADLWFDVNADGIRAPGEDLLDVAGPMLLGWRWAGRDPATPAPTIRFDAADAAWLAAYTHLLAGVSEGVLTYDPTASITRVAEAGAAMTALSPAVPNPYDWEHAGTFVDTAFVMIDALNQTPDAARAQAAQAHFLEMVAQNRIFWRRVAAETDNAAEWLPNDRQQSALGIVLAPGTGAVWMGVLTDLEAVLKGDLLIPYWRLGPDAGVNIGRMFTDPRPIDVAGWLQGTAALPYLQRGPLADGASLAAFDSLVQGEAMLMAIFLN